MITTEKESRYGNRGGVISKWINKELFGAFQEEKKQEKDSPQGGSGIRRMDYLWKNPDKGTDTTPKVYVGRFLPDPKGNFYKKYFYHMFKSGEKWAFFMCPKTHNMDNFCPICSATNKLYMGTAADKKMAKSYKRKEKFVGNFFIQDDPRDSEREPDDKVKGQVKLYEFPGKVEMKLKEQITDNKYGLGPSIFDPGENGYDFIIKILSTKKDPSGNIWPDYSNSEFSRRPSAIADSDSEIERIMSTTIDIDEYLNSMEKDDDAYIQVLKAEMLWDLVKDEWERVKGKSYTQTSKKDLEKEVETSSSRGVPEDDIDDSQWDDDSSESSDSDEDLLKELENL